MNLFITFIVNSVDLNLQYDPLVSRHSKPVTFEILSLSKMSEERFRVYNLNRDNISKVTTSLCLKSRGSYCKFICTGSNLLGSSIQALALLNNFRNKLWVDPRTKAESPYP